MNGAFRKFSAALLLAGLLLSCDAHARKGRAYRKLDTQLCPIAQVKFDDGDTFSCRGEKIRVLGVDAPETKHPGHGIRIDQEGGPEASRFTREALQAAKRITIVRGGKDRYGRTLAHVLLDGELLGVKLIRAGLAYETVTHFGDNGMPEFALQILEAVKSSPKPAFEEPYKWRRRHQKR